MSVSALEFPDDAAFIRGYNTTLNFTVTLTNNESDLRIDSALPNEANYDVTVLTARRQARRRRDVSAAPGTSVTQQVQVPAEQLTQPLDYASQIVITGQVHMFIRYFVSAEMNCAFETNNFLFVIC